HVDAFGHAARLRLLRADRRLGRLRVARRSDRCAPLRGGDTVDRVALALRSDGRLAQRLLEALGLRRELLRLALQLAVLLLELLELRGALREPVVADRCAYRRHDSFTIGSSPDLELDLVPRRQLRALWGVLLGLAREPVRLGHDALERGVVVPEAHHEPIRRV